MTKKKVTKKVAQAIAKAVDKREAVREDLAGKVRLQAAVVEGHDPLAARYLEGWADGHEAAPGDPGDEAVRTALEEVAAREAEREEAAEKAALEARTEGVDPLTGETVMKPAGGDSEGDEGDVEPAPTEGS